jgi:hypothetical protein
MTRLLRARIARHTARAEVFASAYLAAAMRGDLIACQYFREKRDEAAHVRDQLREYLNRIEHGQVNPALHALTWLGATALGLLCAAAIVFSFTH